LLADSHPVARIQGTPLRTGMEELPPIITHKLPFKPARNALMNVYEEKGHKATREIPCPFTVLIDDDVELCFMSNPQHYTYSQVIAKILDVKEKIPRATAQELADALKEWVEKTGKRNKNSMAGVMVIFDTPDKALAKLEDSVDSLQPDEVEPVKKKLVELLNKLNVDVIFTLPRHLQSLKTLWIPCSLMRRSSSKRSSWSCSTS